MFNSNLVGLSSILITAIIIIAAMKLWHLFIWRRQSFKTNWNIPTSLKYALIFLFIFCLFYFEFIRTYIFENLNFRMKFMSLMEAGKSPEKYADYTDSWLEKVLQGKSSMDIYYLKYIATITFFGTYFFLTQILSKLFYPTHYTLPYSSLIYILGFLGMLFTFCIGLFELSYEMKNNFYLISMEIGHFFQSSLPAFLLAISFKIYLSTSEVENNE